MGILDKLDRQLEKSDDYWCGVYAGYWIGIGISAFCVALVIFT